MGPQSISVTHGSNAQARHAPLRLSQHEQGKHLGLLLILIQQHLPSTQLSVSVPERLRSHMTGSIENKTQSQCNRYQSSSDTQFTKLPCA